MNIRHTSTKTESDEKEIGRNRSLKTRIRIYRVSVEGSKKALWVSGNRVTSWGEDMKKQLLATKC